MSASKRRGLARINPASQAPDGFSSGMLRGIDVSAGSLGKMAKLGLGRPRTVAILPYPGALDVNVTRVAMPDFETSRSPLSTMRCPTAQKSMAPATGDAETGRPIRPATKASADVRWRFSSGRAERTPVTRARMGLSQRQDPSPHRRFYLQVLSMVTAVIFLCGFNFLSVLKNEEGNKHYKKGQVGKAKSAYQSALKGEPTSPEIAFNLGNAYYKEESFKDSLGTYKKAAESAKDPVLQSKSFYNLGNTLYRSQDAEKAIQFYKQALRVNPKDQDAKYNLELLTKKSKEDQKKDQRKDKQDQKQDQNKQQQDQQDQGGGQGQSSDQKDQKQDQSQGGGEGAGKEDKKEGQDKQEGSEDSKEQNQDQKDQKSQGEQSAQEERKEEGKGEQQENKGQSGSQGEQQEEKKQDESQGLGQGQEDEDKKDEQKEQQSSAGQEEEKGEEQPKPTEAELRAEQILDALENQEQKILKMSGNDRQFKRIQKYVEKDW